MVRVMSLTLILFKRAALIQKMVKVYFLWEYSTKLAIQRTIGITNSLIQTLRNQKLVMISLKNR